MLCNKPLKPPNVIFKPESLEFKTQNPKLKNLFIKIFCSKY